MRGAIACCGIVAALAAAPAWAQVSRPATTHTIRVDVAEWSVVPSVGVVSSGRTRIDVRNLGREAHRIMLVRTDTFDPRLQLRGDRAVVHPVATSVLVRPGRASSFVVALQRGSYLVLDNLPWHYWKGTSAAFSVR
jgi:uncharacterized cupredoxin-like copper-binding protein